MRSSTATWDHSPADDDVRRPGLYWAIAALATHPKASLGGVPALLAVVTAIARSLLCAAGGHLARLQRGQARAGR